MILSSLLSRIITPKSKANRFFGLVLRESSATGYAYEQTDVDLEILKTKTFSYSKNFDKILDDTDEIIYEFENELKVQFNKVIFVLPVCGLKGDGKEVIQPYRSVISEIVHNLELEAMGYIEMTDVLKDSFRQHESAVYIEVGKFKTQIVFTKEGEVWNQLSINTNPANVLTHLSEFITKGTHIYLYSLHEGVNINALQVALVDYVVHVCSSDEISVGLQKLLKKQLLSQNINTEVADPHLAEHVDSVATAQEAGENVVETSSPEVVVDTLPIAAGKPFVATGAAVASSSVVTTSPDSVAGFKIFASPASKVDDGYVHSPNATPTIPSTFVPQPEMLQPSEQLHSPAQTVQDVEVTSNISDESEPSDEVVVEDDVTPKKSKKKMFVKSIAMSVGIILCIVLAGLIVFELYLHKVTLVLSVPTESFKVTQALSAIPVSKVVEEKKVDVKVDTTGRKEIGERAKGKIILASFDDKEASFSAGTLLYLDDAAFKLDADVVLAPATVDTVSGTKQASKKTVDASATFIGVEGNIPKDKQFAVEDYPSSLFYGLSESSFSGGSQQTVSVVSEEDINKLNDMVAAQAKQTSESVKAGTSRDVVTLDNISTVDMSDLTYSSDVGEVASAVQAEGSVKAVLYVVQKGTLIDVLQKAVKEEKGKSFQFLNTGITYTFSDEELAADEQTCSLNLDTSLNIFEALDIQNIKNSVRMNLDSQATQILKDKFKISDVKFVYNPVLPVFQAFIPYRTENIDVEINPVETEVSQ